MIEKLAEKYGFDYDQKKIYNKKNKHFLKPYWSKKKKYYRVKLYLGNGFFLQVTMRRACSLLGVDETKILKRIKWGDIFNEK